MSFFGFYRGYIFWNGVVLNLVINWFRCGIVILIFVVFKYSVVDVGILIDGCV